MRVRFRVDRLYYNPSGQWWLSAAGAFHWREDVLFSLTVDFDRSSKTQLFWLCSAVVSLSCSVSHSLMEEKGVSHRELELPRPSDSQDGCFPSSPPVLSLSLDKEKRLRSDDIRAIFKTFNLICIVHTLVQHQVSSSITCAGTVTLVLMEQGTFFSSLMDIKNTYALRISKRSGSN